jgi:hypothetical protein
MHTPFLPSLRPFLAPLGGRSDHSPTRSIRQATLAQIEQRLGKVIDSKLLNQNDADDYSRERIFTLARTFWCWIWQVLQANTSCREVVRQVQALFAIHGRTVDESSSAYCQARAKLSLGFLQKVFLSTTTGVEQAAPGWSLLGGRPLRVVDGSGMRLADTAKNRAAFAPPKNQPPGTGFPYIKVLVLFSLQSGAVLAHSIGSLLHHELRLLLGLRKWLKKGDILVMDRAFGVYLVGALLSQLGVDLLARLPNSRKMDFRKAFKPLGALDALFIWQKPPNASPLLRSSEWLSLPAQLTVRVLRAQVYKRGFRVHQLTLVTTLLDPQLYPADQILEAYLKRWRMEMCFDDLKTTLEMEYLACQTPKMVHKELLIFLTAHNFLRWIMIQAAQSNGTELQRISFKGSLDGFRQFTQALTQIGKTKEGLKKRQQLWMSLLQTLSRDLIPERPGRREPRAVKRRQKYDYLNKPRCLWKDRPGRRLRAILKRRQDYIARHEN